MAKTRVFIILIVVLLLVAAALISTSWPSNQGESVHRGAILVLQPVVDAFKRVPEYWL